MSKERTPMAREVVLRALWNAAGEDKKNPPTKEDLERLVRTEEPILYLAGRYMHVRFTEEFPIVDMESYDAYYGEGAGKAVLDELLEKPIAKQLSLREFLKRKYDREKARRTREINRKRKAAGLDTFWPSRVRMTNRPYKYTGNHIGKRGKKPRKFKGQHNKTMDAALETRIKEGKVDKKWINTETASASSGSNSKTAATTGQVFEV